VVLSTCNRAEIYGGSESDEAAESAAASSANTTRRLGRDCAARGDHRGHDAADHPSASPRGWIRWSSASRRSSDR
jgi:glutamyl-tRNA reductase